MENIYWQVRGWIGENHNSLLAVIGGTYMVIKTVPLLKSRFDSYKISQALKKWDNAPVDMIILHTIPRGRTIPNLSPFAMKLETYLRIANLPYEFDSETPWSTVGKTPWITVNGEHIYDSQKIIWYLNNKHNVKIGHYTESEQAVAKSVRIMMDEFLYWGIGLWRYSYSGGKGLNEIFNLPPAALKQFYKATNKRATKSAWAQGLGRHSQEHVIALMLEVLKTASLLLGDKEYLLGNEPCEEDCSLFGFVGMVLWATPGSPYLAYMKEELPNLVEYCNRMKNRYWKDWEQCLAK